MSDEPLTCFLIAPFGEKEEQLNGGTEGKFDLIRASIKDLVESYPHRRIVMKRADEIFKHGSVAETFIGALRHADIVVADLSATRNANVYYELGIRFALQKRITIPIWQKGTRLPADVRGLNGVEYNPADPAASRARLHGFIRERLDSQGNDSEAYRVLPTLEVVDKQQLEDLERELRQAEERFKQALLDQSAEVLRDEARQLLSQGKQEAAVKKMLAAHTHAPNNLPLAIECGQLLSKANHHDDAIAVLQPAVQLAESTGKNLSIAYRELGMAYSRAKSHTLALDWLRKAVDEDPSDSDTHGIIGGAYKRNYDFEKAMESYERGFDVDRSTTYCVLNAIALRLVRNQSGDKLKVKQLLRDADVLTQEAASKKNADIWALFDRAHWLLYSRESAKALKLFRRALRATNTIGELESARSNLLLLREEGIDLPGLTEVLAEFEKRASSFPNR